MSPEARYFGFIVPALITIVFTAIGTLSHPRFRIAGQVIIVIVVVALSAGYWLKPKPFNYYRDLGVAVKAETGRDDVIISDLAWAMSWYGNRKAVWLTYDIDTMDKISKTIPIKYAFISVEAVIRPLLPYKDNVWQKLFIEPSADSVPGFKLVKTFYVHKQPLGVLYKIERSQASSLP